MTSVNGLGYTYDSSTRKVVFREIQCWSCNGSGLATEHILCPRWGKAQRGKVCVHCGSKSKSHNTVGTKEKQCHICNGVGAYTATLYDHLDLSPLAEYIRFTMDSKTSEPTFNESYLGFGLLCGTTDYGAYIKRNRNNRDAIFADIKERIVKEISHRQSGNVLSHDGYLVREIAIITNPSGWSAIAGGSAFGSLGK